MWPMTNKATVEIVRRAGLGDVIDEAAVNRLIEAVEGAAAGLGAEVDAADEGGIAGALADPVRFPTVAKAHARVNDAIAAVLGGWHRTAASARETLARWATSDNNRVRAALVRFMLYEWLRIEHAIVMGRQLVADDEAEVREAYKRLLDEKAKGGSMAEDLARALEAVSPEVLVQAGRMLRARLSTPAVG